MLLSNAIIGLEVVRSLPNNAIEVGRTGKIIDIDPIAHRIRVEWKYYPRTWLKVLNVEPVSIPYKIIAPFDDSRSKYIRL
jgi:hypothetical protein